MFFLSLEAASPDLLEKGMNDGTLPNLAALRELSYYGEISSLRGIGANALWPSVYTGVDPALHGRFYHSQLQDDSYHSGETHQFGVMRKTIWEEASAAGRRVAILDLPKSPASAQLNGIQVLDWNTHYSYADEFKTVPAALKPQVQERFGDTAECPCLQGRYVSPKPGTADNILAKLQCGITATQTLLSDQLRTVPWDLCMASFGALHCAGHQLWHMHDPSHPWHQAGAGIDRDPLLHVYRAIDQAVGALIDDLSPDTAVVILAGPGMGPNYVRTDLLDEILVKLDSGQVSPSRGLNKTLKKLWHRLPPGSRQRLSGLAHSLEGSLQARDRSGRRYFSLQTNDNVGGIKINLQGREPGGLVASDELDRTCDELIEALRKIRIVDSGQALALDIFRTNTVYSGEYLAHMPDILIEWNQPGVITAIESDDIGLITQDRLPDLSGTHNGRLSGLIRLPGGVAGPLPPDAGALDIAPTLAALCGLDTDNLPGQVLVPVT